MTGRVVLVTGAAGGIGRALCRRFAAAGDRVVALDRSAGGLAELAAELPGIWTDAADLTDAAAVAAAVDAAGSAMGRLDVLVNNAGGADAPTLAALDLDAWRREIGLNLDGTFHVVHAVRPVMIAQGGGAIVTVGSVNGLAALGHPAYSAAKAALVQLTRSLAVELGPHGIRANIVCPGTVRTPAWDDRVRRNPEVFERLRKWYPLGRVVEPDEVAAAVQFLASGEAGAITGAVLTVDAGLTAGNAVMAAELTLSEEP